MGNGSWYVLKIEQRTTRFQGTREHIVSQLALITRSGLLRAVGGLVFGMHGPLGRSGCLKRHG